MYMPYGAILRAFALKATRGGPNDKSRKFLFGNHQETTGVDVSLCAVETLTGRPVEARTIL